MSPYVMFPQKFIQTDDHMKTKCIKCNITIKNLGKFGKLWCENCGMYVCYNCKKGEDKCPVCRKKMKYEAHMLLAKLLAFAFILALLISNVIFYFMPDIQGHPLEGREDGDEITLDGKLIADNETAIYGIDTQTGILWSFNDSIHLETESGKVDLEFDPNTDITPADHEIINGTNNTNGTKNYHYNSSDYVQVSGVVETDEDGNRYVRVTELERTSPLPSMSEIGLWITAILGPIGLITATIFFFLGRKHEKLHAEKYRKTLKYREGRSRGKVSLTEERNLLGYDWTINPTATRIRRTSLMVIVLLISAFLASILAAVVYGIGSELMIAYFVIFMGLVYSAGFYYRSKLVPGKVSISSRGMVVKYGRTPVANSLQEARWNEVLKLVITNASNLTFVLKNREERILFSTDVSIIEKIILMYLTVKKRRNEYDRDWRPERGGDTRAIRWKKVGISQNLLAGGIMFLVIALVMAVMSVFMFGLGDLTLILMSVFILLLTTGLGIMGVIILFFGSLLTGMKRIGLDRDYLHFQITGKKRRRIFPCRIPRKSITKVQFAGLRSLKQGIHIQTSFGLSYHIPNASKGAKEWLERELKK